MFRLIKTADSLKDNNKNDQSDELTYASMRKLAFTFTPDDMGIKMGNDYQVFGAVVDMGVDKGKTATMICFIDGTASLYFSNGGGIIGAGQHEAVKKAVSTFLESCFQALPAMKKIDNIDTLPEENNHTFYLFTRAGIFSINIDIQNVDKSKEYKLLFSQSQLVLNEMRKVSKKNN
ncbi:hypothetical protein LY28_00849 [Ruminiclostridium sufflavum DSM 19573]|uniref:Uncharacterized protein n=1 Tax=Ruminiclostridium sufflavum DSM 19573 TaxID=1121337 RepID=A0A318Y0X5_9FIRM|nr:hypothetical protein [Ruminiclostridium sufflavum]PYG89029.1 hypothetical protein LY28_00849 [Ruminiclostridium sufflavum DSM 19573]